jgi:antitoxin component YwqK of YwqJK toxin-antitoxin module
MYTHKRTYTNYNHTQWTDRYYINNHLDYEEDMLDGKVHGHARKYDSVTGDLMSEMPYESGVLHGRAHHYTRGRLVVTTEWRNGRPTA